MNGRGDGEGGGLGAGWGVSPTGKSCHFVRACARAGSEVKIRSSFFFAFGHQFSIVNPNDTKDPKGDSK